MERISLVEGRTRRWATIIASFTFLLNIIITIKKLLKKLKYSEWVKKLRFVMIAPKLFNVQISSLIRCILVLIVHDIVILVIMLIRIVVVIIRMMIIIIILIITIIITIVIIITCVIILILNNYVGGNNNFNNDDKCSNNYNWKIYNDGINEINKRYFEISRDALKSQNKVHISKAWASNKLRS